MGNESLAALLKNKEFHQKKLVKSVAITIALLLMISFLYSYSASAQVMPVRYNIKDLGIEVGFTEYDPMYWCPYTDFFLGAHETVDKIGPDNPGKPVSGSFCYFGLYKDDCYSQVEGYGELDSFELKADRAQLREASLNGTATLTYYKEELCCFPTPYGQMCYTCVETMDDAVTIDIEIPGSGELVHDNQTVRNNMPNLRLRSHTNALYRLSSATIKIKGEYTDINKEIIYPFDDPENWEYANIVRINHGSLFIQKP
ncbi:MAG: hypothetical protein ACMUIU_18130 [bacterium]